MFDWFSCLGLWVMICWLFDLGRAKLVLGFIMFIMCLLYVSECWVLTCLIGWFVLDVLIVCCLRMFAGYCCVGLVVCG